MMQVNDTNGAHVYFNSQISGNAQDSVTLFFLVQIGSKSLIHSSSNDSNWKSARKPLAEVGAARLAELRRNGLSWSQVCRTLNVSKGSAQRSVATIAEARKEPD